MRKMTRKIWDAIRGLGHTPESGRQQRSLRVRPRLETLEDRSLLSANASGLVNGTAFIDQNHNGVFDPGEITLPGVSITLSGTTTQGTAVNVGVTTNTSGTFTFNNVLPGTYSLTASPNSNFVGTPSFSGVSSSSGVNIVSGINITSDQTASHNVGYQGLAPAGVSIRQFLSTTTNTDFTDLSAPAGSGTVNANYRPNSAPTILKQIADVTVSEPFGQLQPASTSIDLAANFTDPDMTNSEITFNTNQGQLNVTLFDTAAPQTVANFFDYINAGDYNNSIFSRLVSNFVLQGGGASISTSSSGDTTINAVPVLPAVPNEFSSTRSNTVGTLALAQSANDPNSGTNQFFFNLVDNSSSLDAQDFTVFGQVATSADQTFLNTLAATPTTNESSKLSVPSVDFQNLPLQNYTGTNFPTDSTASNYLVINSVTTDKRDEYLTYSVVGNTNPSLVSTSITNERLTLNYGIGQTGTSAITVRATDRYGAYVDDTFNVTVTPTPAPTVTNVTIGADSASTTTKLTATPVVSTQSTGTPSETYQWLQNGTAITGQTASTLNLNSLSSVKVGDKFSVQAIASDSTGTSAAFTSQPVTIASVVTGGYTLVPPSISAVTLTPTTLTTSSTTLTANVTSSDPAAFNYVFSQNGTALATQTSPTLDLSTLSTALASGQTFSVTVTPVEGSLIGSAVTSSTITVS